MDRGSALSDGPVPVDQAIFTSVRSPTGQGYRLIAASAGIRAEERAEITRSCPSHDSLCDSGPSAEAVLSFPLSSGRYCVAWSRHAGVEHTGRGGQRVHTQLVVLGPGEYAAFGECPVKVRAAMAKALSGEPDLKPPAQLPALSLSPDARKQLATALSFSRIEPSQVCGLASLLMTGRRVVLAGAKNPIESIEWCLESLPVVVRRGLSISAGLKFSPARRVQLACLEVDQGQTRRATTGQDLVLLNGAAESIIEKDCEPWFGFVRRSWAEGRFGEIRSLTADQDLPGDPRWLAQIARLADFLATVASAGLAELATFRRFRLDPQAGPLASRMYEQLQERIAQRNQELERERRECVIHCSA